MSETPTPQPAASTDPEIIGDPAIAEYVPDAEETIIPLGNGDIAGGTHVSE